MLRKRANGTNAPVGGGTIYFVESATKPEAAHWPIAAGKGHALCDDEAPFFSVTVRHLTKSTTLRSDKKIEVHSLASVLRRIIADETPLPEDWATALIARALTWQFEQIEMRPTRNPKTAAARAREARTMTELVRTLEKLDAANRRREAKGRKAKPRDDTATKEEFIRRLDQLLAAGGEGGGAGKPEPG
jgi:hypothetical protein